MKNNKIALALALALMSPLAIAEDNGSGHVYLGAATGYYVPDNDRGKNIPPWGDAGIGNSRTAGLKLGYEFNNNWALEYDYITEAFSPGDYDISGHEFSAIHFWGHDTRVLMEMGLNQMEVDREDSTTGLHLGVGVSSFITDSLEIRADLKAIYFAGKGSSSFFSNSNEESYMEGLGTLSLNYHFGRESSKPATTRSSAMSSSSQPAPAPTEYREPIQTQTAPVVAPVAAPAPRTEYTLINFSSDSIDVGGGYGDQLDAISEDIKSNDAKAVIEGHTDNQGSAQYNQYLSEDRAIMVKRELKQRGVNGEDLTTVGYGDTQPVADNETEEGRRANRRVEVKVYEK